MSVYLIAHIGHTTRTSHHVCWWKPDSCGYTVCIEKAGLYDEAEARLICAHGSCIAVKKDEAAYISRGTPYFRDHQGEASRLYDGGEHVVVPNSPESWRHLMTLRLNTGMTMRPTPIPRGKSKAFYLPAAANSTEKETTA